MVVAVGESLMATGRAKVTLADADYDAFAAALTGLTVNQARQLLARVAIEDGTLTGGDLGRVNDLKASALRDDGLLEYFPAEDNPTELGGFGKLRDWLDRAALARTPQAASMNLPAPGGVLLVGVQGCGKSLAAKYVARAWKLPLLKLDAARLYDKYIGETEKNLRRAIATAESLAPVVLWLDEIEKAMATSGGDDGGVSQRMLGSFLTWLQEKRADVFVVATANDLSKLPPELLRKGRFDEIFFVDLPTARRARADPPDPPRAAQRGPRLVRPGGPGRGERRLLRRRDRAGRHRRRAALAAGRQAVRHRRAHRRAEGHGAAVSVSRAEDVTALRAWAAGRFVPVG